MKYAKLILTATLLAACATAFADNSGTLKRKGKVVPVTAIYVEPAQGSDTIIFSDNVKATKTVKEMATGWSTTNDIFSGDHVFRELSNQGAHPIQLTISNWSDGQTPDVALAMITAKGTPVAGLHSDKIQLHVDRQDDKRVEGKVTYDDKDLSLDLSFALSKGPFMFGETPLFEPAPPPPPPPPPAHAQR